MATSTALNDRIEERGAASKRLSRWQSLLFWLVALIIFAVGVYLRLRNLGVPFDRDSYDEGVYWQTLRAMSAGHPLYQQTFYSQPPFFILAVFPFYTLFGQTILAARLGIALISLLGLLGALLLGKALSGRIGAVAALLLLVANPIYLTESQTLQADAPSVAFSLLAVGLGYLWWEHPEGTTGLCLSALAGMMLSLGILSKLFVSALVPLGLLLLAHFWRVYQNRSGARLAASFSALVGIAAFVVTTLVVILPFVGSWPQLWQAVVSLHLTAETVFKGTQAQNLRLMKPVLLSVLGGAACYGAVVALLRRDWRVLPLIAWLLVSIYMLWRTIPLFTHHLVALVPPLVALTVIGIGPLPFLRPWRLQAVITFESVMSAIALLLVLVSAIVGLQASRQYLRAQYGESTDPATLRSLQVVNDLRKATQPGQLVITDAQFLVALADRSTPPSLVDTSTVHLDTGYLTQQQLIQQASQPQVHAVLFYTGRLNTKSLTAFYTYVSQHFRLVRRYGNGKELWIRV